MIEVVKGPLTDDELIDLAKRQLIKGESKVVHEVKSGGKIILARKIKEVREALESSPSDRPYDFRGELLGETTFDDFLKKYHRETKRGELPIPQRSDTMKAHHFVLLAEPWYEQVGIVTANIGPNRKSHGYPSVSYMTVDGQFVTVGGIKLVSLIHYFIDGRLFHITGDINRSDFRLVVEAFSAKYGPYVSRETKEYQNAYGAMFEGEVVTWSSKTCSIRITELAGEDRSSIELSHDQLYKEFGNRMPKLSTDDF